MCCETGYCGPSWLRTCCVCPPPHCPPTIPPSSRSVRTLCNHTGTGSQLTFCKGEELLVLGGVDGDWIRCRQGDREGLVPIGYTSLIMWLLHLINKWGEEAKNHVETKMIISLYFRRVLRGHGEVQILWPRDISRSMVLLELAQNWGWLILTPARQQMTANDLEWVKIKPAPP